MSTPPPPPPPGPNPPPYQPQGFPGQQPPMGYQPYGMQPAAPQKTNGLSIASLVLSLVNVIPCFWFLPVPALLGVIFGFVSRSQIKNNAGAKGRGLALAGLIIGLIFLALGAIFWIYVATSDKCYRSGNSFRCVNN